MRLDDDEKAMLAGALGPIRQWAIRHQMAVGAFFDATDFVRIGQAHIMADTESLGPPASSGSKAWRAPNRPTAAFACPLSPTRGGSISTAIVA